MSGVSIVIPADAGIHPNLPIENASMGPRVRGGDGSQLVVPADVEIHPNLPIENTKMDPRVRGGDGGKRPRLRGGDAGTRLRVRGGDGDRPSHVCGVGRLVAALALIFAPLLASAAGIPAVTVTSAPGGGQEYSLTLQILLLMTAVTLLPGIVLMMTAFTRIVIVLAILRQALGAGQAPPNQVLIGLSLFLTLFVMGPVIDKINAEAVQPYMAGTMDATTAMKTGVEPLKRFMLDQTRESDIATFVRISGGQGYDKPEDVPLRILVPAFATSELKSAFQIGFLIFIPFVIIDLVVASVLMSMGMMMLSPVLISLPFKLMLFVLVDGWGLIMGTLAASFYT